MRCAADNVAFNQDYICAKPRRGVRGVVSCRAAAYNYDPLVGHLRSLECEIRVAVSGTEVQKSVSSECGRAKLVVFDNFNSVTVVVGDLVLFAAVKFVFPESHF